MAHAKTDRRRSRRQPIELPVTVRSREKELEATTVDVSPTGVAFVAADLPPLHDWIELVFKGPTFPFPIMVSGRVRRIAKRMFGKPLAGVELDLKALEADVRQILQTGLRDAIRRPDLVAAAAKAAPANPADNRYFRAASCACGWSGSVSRFVRKCPKCGQMLKVA